MASGTFYPAVSGDDGAWYSGNFNSGGYSLDIGHNGVASSNVFVRFCNVAIPQGNTITNAFVRFTCRVSRSTTTVNVNISFNDVDDAVAPTTEGGADGLALTSSIAWNNIGAWTDDIQYDTPELSTILQSIINRGGWSSGNAIQVLLKDNSSTSNTYRTATAIDEAAGAVEKAELHITWELPPEITFTFSNPTPAHLSTVYGTTKQLQLITTVSGSEPSYTYDASFYDSSDVQIGTTVSGINSGSPAASNVDLPTPSGIDYSWYVTATSSGGEDTSSTYIFSNRFLYEGYVTENNNPVSRTVRLYYRDTGELVDTTTSSGVDGYYEFDALINDQHFIVAFDDEAGEDYNALILDKLLPNGTE